MIDLRGSGPAAGQLPPGPPVLLAVDGNSLLHRAYHALSGDDTDSWAGGGPARVDPAGRPIWAIRGMVSFIARAAARLHPEAVLIGFDCPDESTRKADFDGYKAQRPAKPDELDEQLRRAPRLLADAGFPVSVHTGYEADDVLASCAATARLARWRSVLVTSDRDAFALIDEATAVLRVRNGGIDESPLVTAADLVTLCGVPPRLYRDYAALRGDSSDNLPGVGGIGGKTAARLLAMFGGCEQLYALLDAGGTAQLAEVAGARAVQLLADPASRRNVERNLRLMAMHTGLPVPAPGTIRLPLNGDRIRYVLARNGIQLGPSLWAVTGEEPPADDPGPVPFAAPRRRRFSRVPGEGQLALF